MTRNSKKKSIFTAAVTDVHSQTLANTLKSRHLIWYSTLQRRQECTLRVYIQASHYYSKMQHTQSVDETAALTMRFLCPYTACVAHILRLVLSPTILPQTIVLFPVLYSFQPSPSFNPPLPRTPLLNRTALYRRRWHTHTQSKRQHTATAAATALTVNTNR